MALKVLPMIVEVKSEEVAVKRGMSRANKPYTIAEQTVWIDLGGAYPERMVISLDDGVPPYAPGRYVILADCLKLDEYHRLQFGKVRMQTAAGVAAAKVG